MSKKMGLIVLLLGLALIVVVLLDPTGMGKTPDGGAEVAHGPFGDWPPLRMGVLAAGALVGVLGAYGLARKQPEKKK